MTFWIMTFTFQEMAEIISENCETQPIILAQCSANRILQKYLPKRSDTIRYGRSFLETGNIGYIGSNGRPGTSEETIQKVKELSHNDYNISIRAGSSRLSHLPRLGNLRKCLFSIAYKLQNL